MFQLSDRCALPLQLETESSFLVARSHLMPLLMSMFSTLIHGHAQELPRLAMCRHWGHSATLIDNNRILVFGGDAVGGKVADIYFFDIDKLTWSGPAAVTGVSVQPRSCHTATLVGNNQLFVFGGDGVEVPESSLAVLDIAKMEWRIPSQKAEEGPPEPRKGHIAALHKNKLIITSGWGTRTSEYFDDMWTLNTGTFVWEKVKKKGPVPAPRGGAQAIVFGPRLFFWGGWGAGSNMWNELHYMEFDDFTWLKKKLMGQVPSERYNHAAVALKENLWLIFGGQLENKSCSNEFWTLSTQSVY